MTPKGDALLAAYRTARAWQIIGCWCLFLMILETGYVAFQHLKILACMAG